MLSSMPSVLGPDSANCASVLLDRKLVRCRGAATLIEACDLVSETGELIHVKKAKLNLLLWR